MNFSSDNSNYRYMRVYVFAHIEEESTKLTGISSMFFNHSIFFPLPTAGNFITEYDRLLCNLITRQPHHTHYCD